MKKDETGVFSLKFYTPLGKIDDSIRVQESDDAESQYLNLASKSIEENIKASKEFLSNMKSAVVFDIIYQPKETKLLSLAKEAGLEILNGLPMNLEQAVIAFVKATKFSGLYDGSTDDVRPIMNEAR